MVAAGRLVVDGVTKFIEHLTIETTPEGLVMKVYPRFGDGRLVRNTYPLAQYEDGLAVFANPEYDFPARLEYRRTADDGVCVVADGERGGKVRHEIFDFRPG